MKKIAFCLIAATITGCIPVQVPAGTIGALKATQGSANTTTAASTSMPQGEFGSKIQEFLGKAKGLMNLNVIGQNASVDHSGCYQSQYYSGTQMYTNKYIGLFLQQAPYIAPGTYQAILTNKYGSIDGAVQKPYGMLGEYVYLTSDGMLKAVTLSASGKEELLLKMSWNESVGGFTEKSLSVVWKQISCDPSSSPLYTPTPAEIQNAMTVFMESPAR